jgi:hypothetical protein
VDGDGRGGLLKLQRREEVVRCSPFKEGKGMGGAHRKRGAAAAKLKILLRST